MSAAGSTLAELLRISTVSSQDGAFRMIDEQDGIRQHIRIFVNGEQAVNLSLALDAQAEVQIICALSGGSLNKLRMSFDAMPWSREASSCRSSSFHRALVSSHKPGKAVECNTPPGIRLDEPVGLSSSDRHCTRFIINSSVRYSCTPALW